MPLFQLPIAVTLATSAFLSLAFRNLSASKRGKIALPLTSDGPLESRHDPFDVTTPEDIIDGEPIDETSFWANVRSLVGMRMNSVLCFLRRSCGGHFSLLFLLLSRLYRPFVWVIPFLFRLRQP